MGEDFNLSDLSENKTLLNATPDELIAALKKKTAACIVAYLDRKDDTTDFYVAEIGGSWATAYGLCAYYQDFLERKRRNFDDED